MWLSDVNPMIDWKKKKIGIKMGGKARDNVHSYLTYILSSKRFDRIGKKKGISFFMYFQDHMKVMN